MVHNKTEAKSINNDDVDEDHHLDVVFFHVHFSMAMSLAMCIGSKIEGEKKM